MALLALEQAFLLLLFFLPGYFLVSAVFPRRGSFGGDLDPLYRVFVGVLASIAMAVLYGTALVVAGQTAGTVLFQPELLWPGLAVLTVVLFALGVLRGAYPRLRRWVGLPVEEGAPEPEERAPLDRLVQLAAELEEAERARRKAEGEEAERLTRKVEAIAAEKRRLEAAATERI